MILQEVIKICIGKIEVEEVLERNVRIGGEFGVMGERRNVKDSHVTEMIGDVFLL